MLRFNIVVIENENRAVLQFIAEKQIHEKKSTCKIANHTFENEHLQSLKWHLILLVTHEPLMHSLMMLEVL